MPENNPNDPSQNPNPNPNPANPNPNPVDYTGYVSPQELETLLRKVRKEEKDKLYAQIEALQNDKKTATESIQGLQTKVQELESKLGTADSAKTEIESLKAQIEELKKKNGVNPVPNNDPNPNPNNQPQPNPEVEALKKQLETLTQLVQTSQKETQEAKAQQLREKLVAEKGSTLYPEFRAMVQGATPEEIQASIENAVKVQQAVYQRVSAETVHIPPANPEAQMNFGEITPDQIQNMSMEQWAEYRKKIIPGVQ